LTLASRALDLLQLFFSHDIDHQRFKQQAPEGNTYYFDAFGVHAELFVSGTSQWYDYLGAGGTMLGVRVLHSDNSVTTRYFHTDHLGSIAVITNETGAVVERDSYDAWGKRRFPTGADDPTGSISSQVTHGFTGQEELADVGLVHLSEPRVRACGTPLTPTLSHTGGRGGDAARWPAAARPAMEAEPVLPYSRGRHLGMSACPS
jgi:hypothetical protein